MTTTPHLALPLIAAAQAQKHVTHNEALFAVDALLHCAVKDKDLAAPPASPAEGDRYIVAGAATGRGPARPATSRRGRTAPGASTRRKPAGSPSSSTSCSFITSTAPPGRPASST
jgi:hypothetical protein